MNAEPITFYESRYYMFSNFSSFQVVYQNKLWPTSEHAYQAMKFDDSDIQGQIWRCRSAHTAMKLARSLVDSYRYDWAHIKVDIMYDICKAKLQQHDYIRVKLLETGNVELIEASPIDAFWGCGPNKDGLNHLGVIWMQLRDQLREGKL